MPIKNSSLLPHLAAIITVIFVFFNDCAASSFPFRTFDVGDAVPTAEFVEYNGKQNQSIAALKGKNILAVFWGADITEKKEHAVRILKQLNEAAQFFQERNITIFSVNIQGDGSDIITDVLKQSGSTVQVYIDPTQQAYSTLGIYVMPTMLLVNQSGKVVAGFGYSKNSVEHIKGEVEIMLGKKTRAQIEEELNPKVVQKSQEESQAIHHMNFASVMLKRGQVDAAIREFEKALALEPNLAPAMTELGCIYLETGDLAKAGETINKALTLAPDCVRGQRCAAQLKTRQGKIPEGQAELEKLLAANPEIYKIGYTLGRLAEDQGQKSKAAKYYREAYDVLKKQNDDKPLPATTESKDVH